MGSVIPTPLVTKEVRDARIRLCMQCPYKKKIKILGYICYKCGCNINAKTSAKFTSCPIDKW